MSNAIKEEIIPKEYILSANDRCDNGSCGAQAYIKVTGVTGDLFFCSHHYNKIMSTDAGYKKMMDFAFVIVDERDKLVVNKAKGDDY